MSASGRAPAAVGLDIGTSKICAVAVDLSSGRVLALASRPNDAGVSPRSGIPCGRSEQRPGRILRIADDCLREVTAAAPCRGRRLIVLGITGQMHGMLAVDARGMALGNLVTWQDRRCFENYRRTRRTFVEEMVRRCRGERAFRTTGCLPASGYLGTTLFWMLERRLLPAGAVQVGFIDGYVAARLTGGARLYADPTDAAASGLYNVVHGCWDERLLIALRIPADLLPDLRPGGSIVGVITRDAAAATGLPAGTPVCCPIGDHQACILGAGGDPSRAVYVNVGTGGQVSVVGNRFVRSAGIETRPFPGGRFVYTGATLSAGHAYALLERFFREVGRSLLGVRTTEPLFPRMNRLAAAAPTGIVCAPLFTGIRENPSAAGAFNNITEPHFTPGGFARAVLEGIAQELYERYRSIPQQFRANRSVLVAGGNAVRRNPLLRRILAARFGMRVVVSPCLEEAARGAALAAADAVSRPVGKGRES